MQNKFYAKYLIMIGAALIVSACANTSDDSGPVMSDPEPTVDRTPPPPPPAPAPVMKTDQEMLSEIMGSTGADTVNFAYDRYDVDATARGILQAQAEWLKSNNKNVIVEGHCDERGTREYNIALGDRRANAVKNYLVAMGVPASRIRTVSYGKERPIGTDDAANRRGYTRVN